MSAADAAVAFPSLEAKDAEAPFPEADASPLRPLPALAPSGCFDDEDGGGAVAVAVIFCAVDVSHSGGRRSPIRQAAEYISDGDWPQPEEPPEDEDAEEESFVPPAVADALAATPRSAPDPVVPDRAEAASSSSPPTPESVREV